MNKLFETKNKVSTIKKMIIDRFEVTIEITMNLNLSEDVHKFNFQKQSIVTKTH